MVKITGAQRGEVSEMRICVVSNAIESLNIQSRTEGFMSPDIKSMFHPRYSRIYSVIGMRVMQTGSMNYGLE